MNTFRFQVLTVLLLALSLSMRLAHAENVPPPSANAAHGSQSKIPYASLSQDERDILNNGDIDTGQYIAGGILGSFVGLGIGHAVQGRYTPLGLVFTAGEIATASMMVAGATDCVADSLLYLNNHSTETCHTGLFTVGIVGLVALRIWEIVDVWAAPPSINRRYHNLKDHVDLTSTHFYLTPVAGTYNGASTGFNGAKLAVEFRF